MGYVKLVPIGIIWCPSHLLRWDIHRLVQTHVSFLNDKVHGTPFSDYMLMTRSILVIIRHGNNSYLFIHQYQVNKFSKNNLSYLGLNISNDPNKGYTSIDCIH